MATASVTNTFVNGTAADALQVNANFTDLVNFLNNSVVHRDGSKAFTADQAMGGFKLTGLGAGTVAGDAVRFEQAVLKTLADAKGDLIVATAADTFARRAVGANGTVLTADSAEADGVKWVAPAGGVLLAIKTADESVTSSAVVQDDDHLTVTVAANTTYYVELDLLGLPLSTGLRFSLVGPAGAALIGHYEAIVGTGATVHSQARATITALSTEFTTSGNVSHGGQVRIRARLVVAGTAGTFKLQWAQNTSSASTTTLLQGSTMALHPVA